MLPVEIVVWASPLAENVSSRIQISLNRVTISELRGDTISFTKPFLLSLVSSFWLLENPKLETMPYRQSACSGNEYGKKRWPCSSSFNRIRSLIPARGQHTLLISLPDAKAICPFSRLKQPSIQNSGETFYSALSDLEKPIHADVPRFPNLEF